MTAISSPAEPAALPTNDALRTLTPVPAVPGRSQLIDLDGIVAIWWRDVLRFARQRVRLIGGVMRSLVWIVALGLGLRGSFRVKRCRRCDVALALMEVCRGGSVSR